MDKDQVRLLSDKGTPLPPAAARKHAAIAAGVRMLPAETLIVDGVAAPLTADGKKPGYFLFDLPYLDGHDLARARSRRRKALLAELVRRIPEPGPIRFLEHIAGGGEAFHREACRLGHPRDDLPPRRLALRRARGLGARPSPSSLRPTRYFEALISSPSTT